MRIKNISGKRWTGSDGFATVSIAPGEVGELSEARARLLFADYPGDFEVIEPVTPKPVEEIGAIEIEITEEEQPRRKGRGKGK